MARSSVLGQPKYPCTCETQDYDLSSQPAADQKVVADYLRNLADEVEGGLVKHVSFHVSKPKQ
jgi:hypothetical protein